MKAAYNPSAKNLYQNSPIVTPGLTQGPSIRAKREYQAEDWLDTSEAL